MSMNEWNNEKKIMSDQKHKFIFNKNTKKKMK